MQITVDDDTFHKWALDRGYVRLTDISAFARLMSDESHDLAEIADRAAELPIVAFLEKEAALAGDSFTDQVTALENLDDLKPSAGAAVPTLKEATDALRSVLSAKGTGSAFALLGDFGVSKIGDVPEGRRQEFIAAAEKVMQ